MRLDGAPGVHGARYAGEPHSDTAGTTRSCSQHFHGCGAREADRPVSRRARARRCRPGPLGNEIITADGKCEGVIPDRAARHLGGFSVTTRCSSRRSST